MKLSTINRLLIVTPQGAVANVVLPKDLVEQWGPKQIQENRAVPGTVRFVWVLGGEKGFSDDAIAPLKRRAKDQGLEDKFRKFTSLEELTSSLRNQFPPKLDPETSKLPDLTQLVQTVFDYESYKQSAESTINSLIDLIKAEYPAEHCPSDGAIRRAILDEAGFAATQQTPSAPPNVDLSSPLPAGPDELMPPSSGGIVQVRPENGDAEVSAVEPVTSIEQGVKRIYANREIPPRLSRGEMNILIEELEERGLRNPSKATVSATLSRMRTEREKTDFHASPQESHPVDAQTEIEIRSFSALLSENGDLLKLFERSDRFQADIEAFKLETDRMEKEITAHELEEQRLKEEARALRPLLQILSSHNSIMNAAISVLDPEVKSS